MPYIVPGIEPFYIPAGPTGCLLLHGFTAMPEKMLPLDGMDHSLVCDPHHQVISDGILNFLSRQ